MLIRTTLDGVPATVSLTDRAITASRGDDFVVAWDPGGRLFSVVDGERTFRRGLNGRVLITWREDGERRHSWASPRDAEVLVDRAAAVAAGLLRAEGLPADLRTALTRAASFDGRGAAADSAQFGRIYQPIGILPPDQYLALVLQATEGCSFRSCTFCEFYRDAYRVKDAAQFAAHVAQVREYLGASLQLRQRTVFLGSANALAVPMSGLLPIFDVLGREFPKRPVFAFLDGFTGTLKDEADYRLLAARGLARVYIGLESGHDPLLAFVRKPSTRDQAVQTVRAIKAAGIHVGVIVMVGLGGDRFAEPHVADTAAAVNQMNLGAGDLLYFSDLAGVPGSPYVSEAARAGIGELGPRERMAQRRAIEARLAFASSRPQCARYDVREFVY